MEQMEKPMKWLKPTPHKYILYPLAGIAPPRIRRFVATFIERTRQRKK